MSYLDKAISKYGDIEKVKKLLVDTFPCLESAIWHSIKNNNIDITSLLLKNNLYILEHLNLAAKHGYFEIVKLLLANKQHTQSLFEKNKQNVKIYYSVNSSILNMLELLLENKIPYREDLIYLATCNNKIKIIEILLKYNLPCTEKTSTYAIENSYYEIVKLLIKYKKPYKRKYRLIVTEIIQHEFSYL